MPDHSTPRRRTRAIRVRAELLFELKVVALDAGYARAGDFLDRLLSAYLRRAYPAAVRRLPPAGEEDDPDFGYDGEGKQVARRC
jgi:hypothetical protein